MRYPDHAYTNLSRRQPSWRGRRTCWRRSASPVAATGSRVSARARTPSARLRSRRTLAHKLRLKTEASLPWWAHPATHRGVPSRFSAEQQAAGLLDIIGTSYRALASALLGPDAPADVCAARRAPLRSCQLAAHGRCFRLLAVPLTRARLTRQRAQERVCDRWQGDVRQHASSGGRRGGGHQGHARERAGLGYQRTAGEP